MAAIKQSIQQNYTELSGELKYVSQLLGILEKNKLLSLQYIQTSAKLIDIIWNEHMNLGYSIHKGNKTPLNQSAALLLTHMSNLLKLIKSLANVILSNKMLNPKVKGDAKQTLGMLEKITLHMIEDTKDIRNAIGA